MKITLSEIKEEFNLYAISLAGDEMYSLQFHKNTKPVIYSRKELLSLVVELEAV